MFALSESEKRFVQSVGLISGLCFGLYLIRVIATGTWHFLFVPENLALAWIALILGWFLVKQIKVTGWRSWQSIGLGVLWLFFLPNTWYVMTDFLHIGADGKINVLYDIVMMSTLVLSGFILGFASLYMVHRQFLRRLSANSSHVLVGLILLLSSFAIFVGRDLRWSSWDILTHPTGVILNVSDQVVDPFGHPRALNVTALFFILLSTIYLAIWLVLRPAKKT